MAISAGSMDVVAALSLTIVLAAALLLVASGFAKIRGPLPTARALYAADLPAGFVVVRMLGVLEGVVGAAAFTSLAGGVDSDTAVIPLGALAALYMGFAAFLAFVMLSGRSSGSCGCAGSTDLPPSWLHVCANALVVATTGIVYLEYAEREVPALIDGGVLSPALRGALVALSAYLTYLAFLRSAGARSFSHATSRR